MKSFHERLLERFRSQEEFARGYSPLYQALFGQVADWLGAESADTDPLVHWLIEAGQMRQTLDVTLLLPAGLHREVLAGHSGVSALATYFPSVGGQQPVDATFESALREAIIGRMEALTVFLQTANVQTNETARGLCWLLLLYAMNWPEVCLVDLGASAGLNLAANKRAYRLVAEDSGETLLDVGQAPPVQFVSKCRGEIGSLARYEDRNLPEISGRLGCDMLPFVLDSITAEQTLKSYVWADQLNRLARLEEGIAAFREVQAGAAPVQLHQVYLPEELGDFLRTAVPKDESPVVVYNTFMTTYLSDKGASFRATIGEWAAARRQPVLWLQWEPVRNSQAEPGYGWCGWTADLWHGKVHKHWLLGWVHPHGTHIQFEPDFLNFP